jgi:hypothetical protein
MTCLAAAGFHDAVETVLQVVAHVAVELIVLRAQRAVSREFLELDPGLVQDHFELAFGFETDVLQLVRRDLAAIEHTHRRADHILDVAKVVHGGFAA